MADSDNIEAIKDQVDELVKISCAGYDGLGDALLSIHQTLCNINTHLEVIRSIVLPSINKSIKENTHETR